MASLDSTEEAPRKEASSGSNKDVEVAVRMTVKMLNEGGMQVIRQAIEESQDPAQVIGQLLAQIVGTLAEQLMTEMEIDPRIFLANDGWLDKVLDFIETEMNLPPEFSDEIYVQVMDTIKAAAMGAEAPTEVGREVQQANSPAQGAGGLDQTGGM